MDYLSIIHNKIVSQCLVYMILALLPIPKESRKVTEV